MCIMFYILILLTVVFAYIVVIHIANLTQNESDRIIKQLNEDIDKLALDIYKKKHKEIKTH